MSNPPKKRIGQGTGPRRTDGLLLDLRTFAGLIGDTEKKARGLVARGLVPFRRLGGRIYFVRAEIEQWINELDGCTLAEAKDNREMRASR